MKTIRHAWIVCAGMLLLVQGAVRAQGVGLQVGDTADPGIAGQVDFVPGAVVGEEVSFYGLRGAYSVFDQLRVFMDLGVTDARSSELDIGGQIGALMRAPIDDFICDVGLRGTVYFANTDNQDILGGALMAIFSGESLLDNLYLYCGAGADYSRRRWDVDDAKRTEINPALCAGLQYRLSDSLAVFLEYTRVDSDFWGGGIRIR